MLLARDKALSKKLLHYHRIPCRSSPSSRAAARRGCPKRLTFPLIVKSLTQEASIGISQASVVEDEAKLRERVQFIHESIATDAIVEQFVEGRELYCGVIGNQRAAGAAGLGDDVREDAGGPAPHRDRAREVEREVSGEDGHRHRRGEGPAETAAAERVQHISRRAYKVLELSGYARIDLRLDAAGPGLRPRGQPESADRPDRGLRRVSGEGRAALPRAAPADPDDRTALGAGAAGLKSVCTRTSRENGLAAEQRSTHSPADPAI